MLSGVVAKLCVVSIVIMLSEFQVCVKSYSAEVWAFRFWFFLLFSELRQGCCAELKVAVSG